MTATHFEIALRRALNHLYDPPTLRASPLVALLGLGADPHPAQALREALEEGIAALKPTPGVAPSGKGERHYQVLYCRYVQQFTQASVAEQLNLSPRHLRRAQAEAIQALAEHLRVRFDLPEAPLLALNSEGGPGMEGEMHWLEGSLADGAADVVRTAQKALALAQTLAARHAVRLELGAAEGQPLVAVAEVVLKQIVLNLVTAAVQSVPEGTVRLDLEAAAPGVKMRVMGRAAEATAILTWQEAAVDMARRLTALFKGRLAIGAQVGTMTAELVLPSAARAVVLALEDNADTLQLWERYVQDSPFHLVGIQDPHQALETAVRLQPQIIVLDVMLPGIDGWELLAQLRHHPATGGIPIVVCTVLPQEELALSLGARGFIRKPLTRRAFLAALEQSVAARPL